MTDTRTDTHTDGTTAALQYPLRNALRGDNKQRGNIYYIVDHPPGKFCYGKRMICYVVKPPRGIIVECPGEYLLYSRSSRGMFCYIVDHPGEDLLGGRSTIIMTPVFNGRGSKFCIIPTLVQVSAHVILKSLAGGDRHEVSVLTARSKSRIFLSFNNCICFL